MLHRHNDMLMLVIEPSDSPTSSKIRSESTDRGDYPKEVKNAYNYI